MHKEEINYAKLEAKDFKKWKIPFQKFATYCVMYPLTRLFYSIKFTGLENVPKSGKMICAPNHISYCDPFLSYMVMRTPMAFMAKKELFSNEKFAKVLRALMAFAVNREKPEITTMKSVREVARQDGWNLCIFPQGGIKRNKKLEKINRGFVFIAKKMKADILPVSITGIEDVKLFERLFSGHIDVKVGTPVSYTLPDDEIIRQWATQVAAMSGYEYVPEEPETVSRTLEAEKAEV